MEYYQVKENECINKIAIKFGTTKDEILKLNNLTHFDDIHVGDIIRVK